MYSIIDTALSSPTKPQALIEDQNHSLRRQGGLPRGQGPAALPPESQTPWYPWVFPTALLKPQRDMGHQVSWRPLGQSFERGWTEEWLGTGRGARKSWQVKQEPLEVRGRSPWGLHLEQRALAFPCLGCPSELQKVLLTFRKRVDWSPSVSLKIRDGGSGFWAEISPGCPPLVLAPGFLTRPGLRDHCPNFPRTPWIFK